MVDQIANAIRQEIGDRKTIVFTPDVGSGQAIASALKTLWDHHGASVQGRSRLGK